MNIILIGFMASGKSTLGKALAKYLNRKHLDLDCICETNSSMSISEIFEQAGEETFRNLESYYLKKVCQQESVVISTGGGVILRKSNRQFLKKNGFIIWLKNTPEKVLTFSSSYSHRPLLRDQSLEDIKERFNQRLPFYKEASHFTLDTTQIFLKEMIEVIIKEYQLFKSS